MRLPFHLTFNIDRSQLGAGALVVARLTRMLARRLHWLVVPAKDDNINGTTESSGVQLTVNWLPITTAIDVYTRLGFNWCGVQTNPGMVKTTAPAFLRSVLAVLSTRSS